MLPVFNLIGYNVVQNKIDGSLQCFCSVNSGLPTVIIHTPEGKTNMWYPSKKTSKCPGCGGEGGLNNDRYTFNYLFF